MPMMPTFTPASPLFPCATFNCRGDVSQMAWLSYEHHAGAQCYRLSGYHLCAACAERWAREGVPVERLEWRRNFGGTAKELLGAEPLPALVASVLPQVTAPRMPAQGEMFANV